MSQTTKIIKFQQDSEFYYKRAMENADRGEYCVALDSLRRAISADPLCVDYRLALADIYAEMELYEHSNNEYFKLLRDGDLPECFFGLGQNYLCLDEMAYAVSYFIKSLRHDDGLDEDETEYAEEMLERIAGIDTHSTGGEKDFEPMLSWARALIKQGNAEYAIQLLKFIPETNSGYHDACNYIALAYFLMGKYEHSMEYLDRILSRDPDNIFALCTSVSVNHASKNEEESIAARDRLLELKVDSPSDLFKISTALCDINDHKNAARYLEQVVSCKPYDISSLTLLAIAYLNNGEEDKAKNCIFRLVKIDENDSIAKYYNRVLSQKSSRSERGILEYNCQVPLSEAISRIRRLESAARLPLRRLNELYESDEHYRELVRWSLTLNDLNVQQTVFDKLAVCPSFRDMAEELLTDVFVSNFLRKLLLRNLFLCKVRRITVLSEAELKTVKPSYPKELSAFPPVFLAAYADVLSTLAFTAERFESKLVKILRALLQKAENFKDKIKNEEALGALLALEFGMFDGDFTDVCEVFGASRSTVRAYAKLLGMTVGRRAKRA